MATDKKISDIIKISGVDQYIFVDKKGTIAAHAIKDPQKVARIVHFCGQNSLAIGKTQLKYTIFSRNNQKDLLIFPVANYSLGVVKQKNTNSVALADNIIKFLEDLQRKRS